MYTARSKQKGLRLRLRIEAPELATLPWECLFDAENNYVGLNAETPLTRYLQLPRPSPASLVISPPIRILGMVASPRDQVALDVAREQQQLRSAIEHLEERGIVKLTWIEGQTWSALDNALTKSGIEWHIFHFIGHGGFDPQSGEGLLVLADDEGDSYLLGAEAIGRIFSRQQTMRLVILNACEGARASGNDLYSSTGAMLVQRGIPAVVSMQYPITDHAAQDFSRNFYDALASKKSIDEAVTEARYHLSMTPQSASEWATPVLYMHADDGNLFDVNEASEIFPNAPPMEGSIKLPPKTSTPAPPPIYDESEHGLEILRRRVQKFWIESILDKSLFAKTLIDLDMTKETAAVDNPWSSVLERPGEAGQPIPAGRTIADLFDEEGSSLLILGEPGSGKTTTLLYLARALMERCVGDPSYQVPVVFNLSSWIKPGVTILDWLVNELSAKYQIPHKIGADWLRTSRLLPMFDGLDELVPERRALCIDAINAFTQETASVGMVVACRLKEYTDLPIRLALNAAVRLQPLTDVQVQTYLATGGDRLAAVQVALQRDSALRIDARCPLMLSLMMRAYQDVAVADVLAENGASAALRRKQLMDAFVTRMFRRAAQKQVA